MNKFSLTNDRRTILSTLWVFVTLNYIYCDILSLMDQSILNQFLTGNVGGMMITPQFLFWGAILMEVPIALVLLSRILKFRANKIANILGGIIKTMAMAGTFLMGDSSGYYLFFGIIEIATTVFIIVYAWTWKNADQQL